ncbi:error-prone DNA polymerase [Nocardioides sp. Kera G14]|uniref:error-prone DNA polymerase n=1 Tax=Nocardioides sp. Kera G14 TaxID=2884264 RepID=UPI001D10B2A9|nr:error-prone DNA polymerase [Nocardioides sp. Kera G14]UDY24825.1 error-prone DNA polymerase [Nocardioides sp. Kera G14]
MGWENPEIPWRELEKRLSAKPVDPSDVPMSRRRRTIAPTVVPPEGPVVPYAELHAHSHFSFLDGASSPSDLVAEAIRLGLHGLALTDHDGFYGAPALAETMKLLGLDNTTLRTVYGAELSLGLSGPQNGVADPKGRHLLVLARGVEGYHRLAGAITEAQLRGDEKGRPVYDWDELVDRARDNGRDHWLVLTGCRKGFRARDDIATLIDAFGEDNVVVELTDHQMPTDSRTNDGLWALAHELRLPAVATGNVHYATPQANHLADAMAAVRARRALPEMAGWLAPHGAAHLRSGEEMLRRFARYPGTVARSVELADECAFDLRRAKPELPSRQIPEGHTAATWLRHLTEEGFELRYAQAYRHDPDFVARARARVEHELDVVIGKNFPGYFVIVHDIVAFARSEGILCQGRGSAAASAICFALGITAIDPVFYGLPFERFISAHREEEPDIDVDFDSNRREEVIQWVYETYGRRNAAQVANIVGYRPKMAIRDAAKALGHSPGQQDAWSKQVSSWRSVEAPPEAEVPDAVLALAKEFLGAPRHLGIHSGGMILTERPIGEVVPIERARMEKRTVLQWDKDGCEFMGLVKFDLLGLGMLSALDHLMQIVRTHLGESWELATIPKEEPAVYDMLCRADSIGVFQVESRAQIGTLPRLQPRCFYDLAIEIALIRPGPIQGGAVHPYVRRATGREEVEYAHPLLEPVLSRTRGVPLFQEQLMEMGRVLGDFSADDADLLRRAMGSKRGVERIESLKERLFDGMIDKGMTEAAATAVYFQILSFANFGFAESHALSFAKLVYASSWFKLHYPGAFLAGLLRAQPMGFYSPQSLTQDAVRHGVEVRRPDLLSSGATADLEPLSDAAGPTGFDVCLHDVRGTTPWIPGTPDPTPHHRRDGRFAVRLGLEEVRGISRETAERIVAAREEAPFRDMPDLARRARLDTGQLEALATAGALGQMGEGLSRREALWAAGWTESPDQLPGTAPVVAAPELPAMEPAEETLADLWATGITPDGHPFAHLRAQLSGSGAVSVAGLRDIEGGTRVTVGGMVTHRQRPSTAGGVTFLNLEDETGMLNVVCSQGVWAKFRRVATSSSTMLIRGIVEKQDGVLNLVADRLSPFVELRGHRSRDFR